MKNIIKIVKSIIKIILYLSLYFIVIYWADIRLFNRYCDLTDIIGYNNITDFVHFISQHFIPIANIITLSIIVIFSLKKLKESKHL